MKIVLLEDSQIEYKKIKTTIEEWAQLHNITLELFHYLSGEQFFKNTSNFDSNTALFLLDIEMKDMNGIEVAKKLRSLNYKGHIIFLTAFKEFVFEGYNVHAFNYLVKPLDKNVFFQCLTEIEKTYHAEQYTFRNKQKKIVSIPYPNIISFSVIGHYVYITTQDETIEQYINLNAVINKLPRQFVKVHRSCIINMAHIQKVSQKTIFLSNGCTVEIGRTYSKNFKSNYLQYLTRFNRDEAY